MINKLYLAEIKGLHAKIKDEIADRIDFFKKKWENGTEEEIFAELAFCIFTPQSKARSCWAAVEKLLEKEMLYTANAKTIAQEINIVRFRNNKAQYLVDAREFFTRNEKIRIKEILSSIENIRERRDWIVKNVKGIGFKEAGHFLRNVGFTEELAILDRHILKNLVKLGVLDEIPKTLTKRTYFNIEEKMFKFSAEQKIPMGELDFVLWYKEAGEVFK